ncbi:MAG: hypothetical protein EXS08_04105 [Planctomycetes bacterium]|nr:hypothetical protein [Planctomycetota bacterium]
MARRNRCELLLEVEPRLAADTIRGMRSDQARARAARGLGPLLACLLSCCVSIGTIEGYRASGPGARYCGPLPPLCDDTWEIPLPAGAAVIVLATRGSVYPTPFEQLLLDVRLLIPDGVTVQMLSNDLVLSSAEWSRPRVVPVLRIEDWTTTDPAARTLAAGAALRGSARTAVHPGFGLSLVTEGPRAQTGIPWVGEFQLQLPTLRVDGRTLVLEPLRFEGYASSGVRLAPD